MDTTDIILAVASPPGWSLRGIIRGSGPGALTLVGRAVTVADGAEDSSRIICSRGAHRVRIAVDDGGQSIPAILLAWPGPGSYTGEASFEILLPGAPALMERVIERLILIAERAVLPARRAEPGEFSARAFLNARMSLVEAEGVSAVIAAESDAELRAGRLLLSGRLGGFAHALADDLAAALALVEAGIDFTDQEDVIAIEPADLLARLRDLAARIDAQLSRAVGFEELEAIPWVVIVGPPNAGKSTLFNALLGRDRAVVSSIAGTTRDVLCEPLHLAVDGHDAEVMLVDLAGLDPLDPSSMNRRMQVAARSAIDRAELLIVCEAPDAPGTTTSIESNIAQLRVLTKWDLVREPSGDARREAVAVSAQAGEGLTALRCAIAERLAGRAVSLAGDALALQPRHETALRAAAAHLGEAIHLVEPHHGARRLPHAELIAAAMRAGLDELAMLAGDISPDEVLGRIFASFCVGK